MSAGTSEKKGVGDYVIDALLVNGGMGGQRLTPPFSIVGRHELHGSTRSRA